MLRNPSGIGSAGWWRRFTRIKINDLHGTRWRLFGLNYKASLADCLRCGRGLEDTAEHAFYCCERVCPFWNHVGEWTARIEPKQLVLLEVGYVVDNVLPQFQGERRVMLLAILAVARMVIWAMRKKGLYNGANCSHRHLILFFRHQLRVKIRCDRKRLDLIIFNRRWVHAASPVVQKGGKRWSHPSLLFLRMATTDQVLRDPIPSK